MRRGNRVKKAQLETALRSKVGPEVGLRCGGQEAWLGLAGTLEKTTLRGSEISGIGG